MAFPHKGIGILHQEVFVDGIRLCYAFPGRAVVRYAAVAIKGYGGHLLSFNVEFCFQAQLFDRGRISRIVRDGFRIDIGAGIYIGHLRRDKGDIGFRAVRIQKHPVVEFKSGGILGRGFRHLEGDVIVGQSIFVIVHRDRSLEHSRRVIGTINIIYVIFDIDAVLIHIQFPLGVQLQNAANVFMFAIVVTVLAPVFS